MSNETIGQRIRRVRLERKLTRFQLSQLVRVREETIGKVERESSGTNMYTFIQIAKVLDVSLDYLAYGEEECHAPNRMLYR